MSDEIQDWAMRLAALVNRHSSAAHPCTCGRGICCSCVRTACALAADPTDQQFVIKLVRTARTVLDMA